MTIHGAEACRCSLRRARDALALGPAGQVELAAAVATIGAQHDIGLTCGFERLLFAAEADLPGADAQPRSQRRFPSVPGFESHAAPIDQFHEQLDRIVRIPEHRIHRAMRLRA